MPEQYQYVWFYWASAFLIPWAALFLFFAHYRKIMLWASILTAPFGLTEPLFVPAYWNPPSLFHLAQTTGFDIESLIFTFATGGIGAVLYNALTHQNLQPIEEAGRKKHRHRWHRAALLLPILLYPILYFLPWNPIYPGIVATIAGAVASIICRPDLRMKTFLGGILFMSFYILFMIGLKWSAPGYIQHVWNLKDLSGIIIYGIPMEEALYGLAFGMYWTGIYEHLMWRQTIVTERRKLILR